MKRNYSLYFLGIGMVAFVIQMLIIGFGYLDNNQLSTLEQFVVVEETTFKTIISDIWAGVIGTLLLMILFVRRMLKGPEAMLVLVCVMLWIVQILKLRTPDMGLTDVVLKYIVGVIGLVFTTVAAFRDAYIIKNNDEDSEK